MRILVACFPKSGSTYLTTLIGSLPGFSISSYVPHYDRREQELSDHEMMHPVDGGEVAQHHVRASGPTMKLIEKHNITPVVLVRNIYDAMVSMADHIANESPINALAFFDERIARLPLEERVSAVADLSAAWYINFFVGWSRLGRHSIVTYEDLILGGLERQAQYLQSIGIEVDLHSLQGAAIQAKTHNTRFNVGKAGRGVSMIDPVRRANVQRMASYYPDVDFSTIGIEPSSPDL